MGFYFAFLGGQVKPEMDLPLLLNATFANFDKKQKKRLIVLLCIKDSFIYSS